MSDRPREGTYLDAALAVVGEQLEERIDELSRRRRMRNRVGIAALAVATVVSGSMAAVALSNPTTDAAAPAPVSLTVSAELRCVDGFDASRPAYFAVSYRTTDEGALDGERACAAARSALAADDAQVTSAAPAALVAMAAELLGEAMGASGATVADLPAVAVDEASFGRLSPVGGARMVACDGGSVSIVLATSLDGAPTALQHAALCAQTDEVAEVAP